MGAKQRSISFLGFDGNIFDDQRLNHVAIDLSFKGRVAVGKLEH